MAQKTTLISLSSSECEFLRGQLLGIMRLYAHEIDADKVLLKTCSYDMHSTYLRMFESDNTALSDAKNIYSKLLDSII